MLLERLVKFIRH